MHDYSGDRMRSIVSTSMHMSWVPDEARGTVLGPDHGEQDAFLEGLEHNTKVVIADEVHVGGHDGLILVVRFSAILVGHLHSHHFLHNHIPVSQILASAINKIRMCRMTRDAGAPWCKIGNCDTHVMGAFPRTSIPHLGTVAAEMEHHHIARLASCDKSAQLLLDVRSSGGGSAHTIAGVIHQHHNVALRKAIAFLEERVHGRDIVHAATKSGLSSCMVVMTFGLVPTSTLMTALSAARRPSCSTGAQIVEI